MNIPSRTSRTLTVTADAAGVAAASAWVRSVASTQGLTSADVFRLDLCITELTTNVAEHGHPPGCDNCVELRAQPIDNGPGIRVDIVDSGPEFDPFSPALPAQVADEPKHARVGGMGLRLVKAFADRSDYARVGQHNVVTVVIRHAPPAHVQDTAGAGRSDRGVERRIGHRALEFPIARSNGAVVTSEERRRTDRRGLGFISTCNLFRGVPYRLIEDLISHFPVRAFAGGQVLLRPGDRNQFMALVVRGRLRVHFGSEDSPDYTEITSGGCAGEMSMIDGKEVSAYVVTAAECQLILIDDKTFLTRLLPIPEVARNLVSILADRMRSSNERTVERFRKGLELDALERELNFAREVQRSLVPDRMTLTPARPEVQCNGFMQPAQQVGGDFYDAFFVQPHRLAVVMGDVCGKGMPAALFMSRTLTLLRSEALHGTAQTQRQHTLDIAKRVNEALCQHNDTGYFASVVVAVLDVSTGMLTWVNAGHPAPALARGSSRFQFLSTPHNMLVGVSANARYSVGETALPPGSLLLLYTDGVTEAENAGGAMYGDAQLLELLNGSPHRDPESIIQSVVGSVETFVRGHTQSDDLTLLALRYTNDL